MSNEYSSRTPLAVSVRVSWSGLRRFFNTTHNVSSQAGANRGLHIGL